MFSFCIDSLVWSLSTWSHTHSSVLHSYRYQCFLNTSIMADNVPQPGPAKLKPNAGPDEWLEAAKNCKYLSETHMKQLCEIVKEFMMEGESAEETHPVLA